VGCAQDVIQRAGLPCYVWAGGRDFQASGLRFLSVLSVGRERPGLGRKA
jgi:hypothetical protein